MERGIRFIPWFVAGCALVEFTSFSTAAWAQGVPSQGVPCEQVLGGYATALENLSRRAQTAEQDRAELTKKVADLTKQLATTKADDKKSAEKK